MRIRKVGIVGAGTMGSGIAALATSAGIPVVLLDIPAAQGGDRNAPAKGGVERAKKAKPAAFMDVARASAIVTGNTEDDLALLADCDLVIEAIIEQPEPKRALYARLEQTLRPLAIVASNTSGIPMRVLTEGRSDAFRSRFIGMHFFNPPRYLHLLEIIPTPDTSPDVIDAVRQFSDRTLGKGIVVANDVPGFIANRLGVYGMVLAIRMMEKHGLSIDEVDVLTGPLLARAKSATFRTADLSGIDVIGHVTKGLAESTGEDFALPAWVLDLITSGRHGEKTGAGFYKKIGKEIQTLDYKTGEYRAQAKVDSPELAQLTKLDIASASPGFATGTVPTATSSGNTCSGSRTTCSPRRRRSPGTLPASITRWNGATPGKSDRLRRWICWVPSSCATDSKRWDSTRPPCCARDRPFPQARTRRLASPSPNALKPASLLPSPRARRSGTSMALRCSSFIRR